MKKILFATTALVATAGMAAADVKISGYGRFGLDYNNSNSTDTADAYYNGRSQTNITSRLRLQFDMSTETDSGVGFNARMRMQSENRDGVARTGAWNAARFGVTYGGLTVNVGNIIGAVENMPGLYTTGISAGTGIDGMGFYSLVVQGASWDAYSSAGVGANGVEALYTFGGFTGHVSYSTNNDVAFGVAGEDRTALMLTYNFGDYYVAGAYQWSSNGPVADTGEELNDGVGLVAFGGDFGQFGGKLAYGSTEAADTVTLEGYANIGAASTIMAWVSNLDSQNLTQGGTSIFTDKNGAAADGTSWGLNYQYDLGGGATLVAGYVDSYDDIQQFQAGVYFKF